MGFSVCLSVFWMLTTVVTIAAGLYHALRIRKRNPNALIDNDHHAAAYQTGSEAAQDAPKGHATEVVDAAVAAGEAAGVHREPPAAANTHQNQHTCPRDTINCRNRPRRRRPSSEIGSSWARSAWFSAGFSNVSVSWAGAASAPIAAGEGGG